MAIEEDNNNNISSNTSTSTNQQQQLTMVGQSPATSTPKIPIATYPPSAPRGNSTALVAKPPAAASANNDATFLSSLGSMESSMLNHLNEGRDLLAHIEKDDDSGLMFEFQYDEKTEAEREALKRDVNDSIQTDRSLLQKLERHHKEHGTAKKRKN
jgi:hypothetical protein